MAVSSRVSSVFRPNLFKGKVAIVTGGGTGIGKAITQELLFLGCKVMIASRNLERLSKSAEEMKQLMKTTDLHHMQCNIRQEDQVKDLMSATIERFGQIDFLVNNGGGQFPSPAAEIKLKGWNAVIETNLTGTFLCCKEAYHHWMQEHGGVIVNIIADMWRGFPMMSHTGAARAAVDNLTKSLAIEWAEHGIRVNSVAPGSPIYSDTAAANYGSADVFNNYLPALPTKRLGRVEEGPIYNDTAFSHYDGHRFYVKRPSVNPAKRFGCIHEVSASVCFLLSPAASFISGETLKVDAGSSLYSVIWNIPDHNKLPAYTWDTDVPNTDDGDSSGGTKSKL